MVREANVKAFKSEKALVESNMKVNHLFNYFIYLIFKPGRLRYDLMDKSYLNNIPWLFEGSRSHLFKTFIMSGSLQNLFYFLGFIFYIPGLILYKVIFVSDHIIFIPMFCFVKL